MFGFFSRTGAEFNLDPKTFSEKLKNDKNAVILDVRTPGEFKKSHIPQSINIDIHDHNFREMIDKLDRTKNYYVYCRSGSRSYHASKYMKDIGFKVVYNLEAGILSWGETLVR